MDLMAAIGLLSSIVTLEEAGRSWVLIVKDKLKRKEIDINNWDSDDPLVQACLDRFKTDMGDKYKDHIFSEEEMICTLFTGQPVRRVFLCVIVMSLN